MEPAHSWPPPSIPAEGTLSAKTETISFTLNPYCSFTASVALNTPKSGPCPNVTIGLSSPSSLIILSWTKPHVFPGAGNVNL